MRIYVLHNATRKALDIPVVMGDLLHNVIFFHLANLFWNMTDSSGPAYIFPSRFRKDNRMLCEAILQQT